MTVLRRIGVWMDHSFANLIEFSTGAITLVTIDSNFCWHAYETGLATNEAKLFFKEHNIQSAYLKELESALQNCNELVLFGPNYSKIKLYHFLRQNKLFSSTRIKITHTENMDENQQYDFVKGCFLAN